MKLNEKPQDLIFIESTGFSMWPFLKAGERLVVKKAGEGDLKIGDIILYHSNNQMVCHRLVKKVVCEDGYLFYARGDNSLSSGELVTEDILIGKVIGSFKNGRFISLSGGWRHFTNRLIVQFGPFLGWASRLLKDRFMRRRFRS